MSGKDSTASEQLIRAVDRDDPRPLWVPVWDWGGWGGRYELYTPRKERRFVQPETRPIWTDAQNEVLGVDRKWHCEAGTLVASSGKSGQPIEITGADQKKAWFTVPTTRVLPPGLGTPAQHPGRHRSRYATPDAIQAGDRRRCSTSRCEGNSRCESAQHGYMAEAIALESSAHRYQAGCRNVHRLNFFSNV